MLDIYRLLCYAVQAVGNKRIFGGIAQLGERLNGIQEVSGSIPLISTKGYDERLVSNRNKPLPFYKTIYRDDVGTLHSHSSIFPIRVVFHFVKTALFCCPNAFHGETDYFNRAGRHFLLRSM